MRLIDADKLRLSHCKECTLYPDKCLKDNCDWDSIYHIDHAKTAEAIPYEWLEKHIRKNYKPIYANNKTETALSELGWACEIVLGTYQFERFGKKENE